MKYIFSKTFFTLKLHKSKSHKSKLVVPNLRLLSQKNELLVKFCLEALPNVSTRFNLLNLGHFSWSFLTAIST